MKNEKVTKERLANQRLKVAFDLRLSVGLMLWMRACLYWSPLHVALPACTTDVRASMALCQCLDDLRGQSCVAHFSQPVPACSTWVSSAIRADVEDCHENALEKKSKRELCQLPLRENRRYRRCNARSLMARRRTRARMMK